MKADFQKLMATPEGKRLVEILTRDGGNTFKSAGKDLQQGNEGAAKEKIAPLLGSSEVQALLQKLEKTMGHG